jgi:hypothetical protein
MSRIDIPSPSIEIEFSPKFKLGDNKKSLEELKHHTLAFSFEYSCFKGTPISLDFSGKDNSDYIDLLNFLSFLSTVSIDYLNENADSHHFHEIDINKKYFLKTFLQKTFKTPKINYSDIPSIYQIAYHNEANSPRVCGFFGALGLFYILWWDFHHLIYYAPAYHKESGFNSDWFQPFIN